MLFVTRPNPPNAVLVIPVVPDVAVGEELPTSNEVGKLSYWLLRVVSAASIKIAIEDASTPGMHVIK